MKLLSPQKLPRISGPLSSSETAYILSMQCIPLQTNLFPHLVLRTEPPCQPTCTPHKHSVLINLLIYILPLAESLLCWDIKNVSFTMSHGSSDESGVLGESGCISMYSWAPYSPETITALLIGYTSIQNVLGVNKKLKQNKTKEPELQ